MRSALVLAMVLVVAVAFLLAGCAAGTPAQLQARRTQFDATIPICHTDKQCEIAWAAARQWILLNSDTKLQHVTSDFMETYNPQNTAANTIRVVKEPMASGGYRILVTVGCRNPFACIPDPWAMAQHFNNYVNSVATRPTGEIYYLPPTPPGPRPAPDWCKADSGVVWQGDRCVEKK
jgi:hypothetical protein